MHPDHRSPSRTDAPPAAIETDPRFPSGPWRGHYIQFGVRSGQQFSLRFVGGKVTGVGRDPVGIFGVHGSYDAETGKVRLRKQYPGSHGAEYDGYAEVQHGIYGKWSIGGLFGTTDTGGFNIRPDGGAAQGEHLEAEAEIPQSTGAAAPECVPA